MFNGENRGTRYIITTLSTKALIGQFLIPLKKDVLIERLFLLDTENINYGILKCMLLRTGCLTLFQNIIGVNILLLINFVFIRDILKNIFS